MAKVGTDVGDKSPYTGNIITKKITIPSRSSGGKNNSSGGGGGSSSNSSSNSSSKTKSTEGSISELAERYGGYNRIPDYEYKKIDQKYGTSYSNRNSGTKTLKSGQVDDKIYANITTKEVLEEKLNPANTRRRLLRNESALRNQRIESRKKIVEGTANARDIFRALGTTNINLNPQNIRKIKVLADENISNRNLNKALKNEKPIFTVGTALRIQGKKPKSKSGVKFIKNSQGQVIGVQDPFLKMSYGFNRPVNEKALKEAFQERQLEKEYLVQFRKQQAQKKFEKLKPLDERYQAIKERLKKNQKARQKFKSVTDKVVDGIAKISSFYPPNYLFKKIYPDSLYNYGLEVTKELATIPYDFTIGLGRSLAGGVDQVAFQIQAVGFKGYGKEVLNQLRLEN